MRVLAWSDLFWPYIGGSEVLMAQLMLELRERGYEFGVVTSHDYLDLPDEDSYEGIPIHRLPLRAAIRDRDLTGLRVALRAVAEVKRAHAPDLVHAVGLGPSVFFHLRTLDDHPAPWAVWLQTEILASQSNGNETLLREALVSSDWAARSFGRVVMTP